VTPLIRSATSSASLCHTMASRGAWRADEMSSVTTRVPSPGTVETITTGGAIASAVARATYAVPRAPYHGATMRFVRSGSRWLLASIREQTSDLHSRAGVCCIGEAVRSEDSGRGTAQATPGRSSRSGLPVSQSGGVSAGLTVRECAGSRPRRRREPDASIKPAEGAGAIKGASPVPPRRGKNAAHGHASNQAGDLG
jgi:hypothetical protein